MLDFVLFLVLIVGFGWFGFFRWNFVIRFGHLRFLTGFYKLLLGLYSSYLTRYLNVFFPLCKFTTSLISYLSLLVLILIFFFRGTPFRVGFRSEMWKTLICTFILVGRFSL